MNQKVFYSMMAASLIPGAALQAAVNVQTSDIALSSQQDGSLAKVTVEFGTLVPGSYTLTGMVDPYKSGMKATFAGVEWDLTSTVINKTITITQVTENATLEISGPDAFTLGAYLLKIDWNLDKDAWDALITSVNNKVGTTFNGKLTDAHKKAFLDQIEAKEEDIEALADAYKTYADNELWKLSEGEDKISQDIKAIETAAEAQVIEDCWATKTAAYSTAVAAVPNETQLSALSTAIGNLQINKDKRQTSYSTLSGQVETYLAGATTAKGTKPTTWQAAIEDVFVYNPTPNAATIMGSYNTLKGYVDTDAANYTRKQAMDARVTAAQTAIGNVNTNNTKNVTARTANATEKSNITSGLNTYKSEALSAYNTAIASDGAAFAYDPTANEVEYPALKALEDRITELSAKIVTDNQNYEATYAAIQDSYAAATTHYNQKMAELTAYITEEEYAAFLEGEQAKLIAKKEELDNLSAGYASTYAQGGDLDENAANDAINGKTNDMDGIVTNAKNTVDKFRTNFAGFQDDIDGLSANLETKKDQAQNGGVYSVVQAEIEAVEGQISQLQANLDAANNSPYAIGDDSYAPETTSGESIADVQDAIDDIDVATAIAEFNAYNNATQAINDAKEQLQLANGTMNSYRANERTGYPTTPSALWTAQYNSILESLEKTGDDNDLTDVVAAKYAAGEMAAYATGENNEFATAIGTIRTNITNYLNDAKAAIDSYCTFYGGINAVNTSLQVFKANETTGDNQLVYNDASVLFTSTTGYKAKVAEIEGKITAAESALATAIGKTGSEHKAAMAALDITSYKVNPSLTTKVKDNNNADIVIGTNADKKLADAIDDLSSNIAGAQTLYNHTDFANYKASKTPVIDPSDTDAVKTVKQNVINALNGINYDDTKSLDENKAAVDNNQTVKSYSDELAAAEIVQFVRNLVVDNYATLNNDDPEKLGLLQTLLPTDHNKMGKQKTALEQDFANLLASVEAIMENDQNPENFKTIDEFELKADPTEEEQQAEGFDPSKYLYNTNVKKVAGFNELLKRIGKATDEVSAGTIYGNYNKLKKNVNDAVEAVQANEDKYAELSNQFDETYEGGMQYELEQAKTTINSYSDWTKLQVKNDVEAIEGLITAAKQALDDDYAEEALTATSTIQNQSTILAAIETLKTEAQNKQTQYLTSEAKYPELAALLSDKSADEQKVQDGDNWKYNYDGYGYTLNQAWEYIEANYNNDDVKASAGTEKDRISGLISDAQTALATARANAALTATSTLQTLMGADYVDIPAAINKMKSDAQKKFQKVEAHNAVVAKYNDVNAALVQERTAAVNNAADDATTQPGAGAVAYYRGLFNNAGGFAARLTAIQTAYEAAYDDPDLVPAEYQSEYTDQLDDLKAEFENIIRNDAAANNNSYKAQMVKYNTAKGHYDGYITALNSMSEQDFVETVRTSLMAYSWETGELKSALETLEGFYTTGASVDNNTSVLETISDIESDMQALMEAFNGEGEDDGSYHAQVKAANDATYDGPNGNDGVDDLIQSIRPAYNAAVQALNTYTGAQDETLNGQIAAKAEALNDAVFGAIQQMSDYTTAAVNQRDAATAAKEIWDATALKTQIQNYINNLNTTKTNFLNDCKDYIVTYWDGVDAARKATITTAYNALNTNGYIANPGEETPESIFASHYAEIAQGAGYIYEQKLKEGTEDEYETVVKDGVIDILGLDNLVFNGVLKDVPVDDETPGAFTQKVATTATNHAQTFVSGQITAYEGKEAGDLAAIKAIFTENDPVHPVDYGKPANEAGVVTLFNAIVGTTINAAKAKTVNYTDDYNALNGIAALLAKYDTDVAALKTTAQGWVAAQEAADLQLATAQGELAAAQAELLTAVTAREGEFNTLNELVNSTSVAGKYATTIGNIQTAIANAKAAATASVPTTLADVNSAKTTVAEHYAKMTVAGQGTVTYDMTSVETGAIADLKQILALLIPDLKVQFNAYAGTAGADPAVVTDWNERIQNAITLTDAGNNSTLAEMAALEEDLAKLRTEMGNLSGAMDDYIADFKNRTQALQSYTLNKEEGVYGNMEDTFNATLANIKQTAATIEAEVIQHETAKDILPYLENLEERISAQETAWNTLKTNAETKARQVAANKTTIQGWKARLNVVIANELEPALNPDNNYNNDENFQNYGSYATLADTQESIRTAAQSIVNYLTNNDEYLVNLPDVTTTSNENSVTYQETRWAKLQEDATKQYNDWKDVKDESEAAYTTLNGLMTDVETDLETATKDIASYGYNNKATEANLVAGYSAQYTTLENTINVKNTAYSLVEDDANVNMSNSLAAQLAALKKNINSTLNEAAKMQAQFLYLTGKDVEEAAATDAVLIKAKKDAWAKLKAWSFSKTVKAAKQTELEGYDEEVEAFATSINEETKSHSELEGYALRAQGIIAEYNTFVADIKDYETNFVFGDATQDHKVNVLDYRTVTNMILDPSLQPAEKSKLFWAIDVNTDEVIEVGDLTAIVNYILNKDWQGYDAGVKGWMDENASESLTMTTSMTQQGTQRIAVNLANVENYTAFQLDVVLPEGMTIVGQTLSDRAGNSHKLYSRAQQDGSIRFLASSIKGETFSGNEGAVLYIDVETGANFNGGNVELLNILFSDTEAQTRAFAVDANGEATGISFMNAIESLKQKVYDLSGRMMNGMKKGVNIIQGADGTTKKVLK